MYPALALRVPLSRPQTVIRSTPADRLDASTLCPDSTEGAQVDQDARLLGVKAPIMHKANNSPYSLWENETFFIPHSSHGGMLDWGGHPNTTQPTPPALDL